MIKVMAFGSFDAFHKGHENYFKQAKALGDYLVVVVSRENNLNKFKEREQWNSEEERLKAVSECKYVDKAVLGNKNDILKVVIDEKPAILCIGYDQFAKEDELEEELKKRGLSNFKIVRAKAFKPEVYKSSKLKK
ncbi:MAG: adenylyltransferase/cytidyltransferase family protein [archaeon]